MDKIYKVKKYFILTHTYTLFSKSLKNFSSIFLLLMMSHMMWVFTFNLSNYPTDKRTCFRRGHKRKIYCFFFFVIIYENVGFVYTFFVPINHMRWIRMRIPKQWRRYLTSSIYILPFQTYQNSYTFQVTLKL